jgi:Mrp family chromosome partitioning ATPase
LAGKIISVVNRKGGVGKTTVTLGLADTLIAETEKPYKAGEPIVLAVDLDPQGSHARYAACASSLGLGSQTGAEQWLTAPHSSKPSNL